MKAVIFDFDGTIADTLEAIGEALNQTMLAHGYPTHTTADVRRFINNGARELVRRAIPKHLQTDEALLDRVYADYHREYGKTYLHTKVAYEGIPELIQELHDAGVRIGVLSNKQHDYVVNLSRQVLPKGCFDAAQGVVPNQPTKPHPYLSELTASRLGATPAECVMVGDSDVDILTAKNAGMRHVGVSWGYRDEETLRKNGATLIAHTPDELKKILNDLIKKGL
jgi:phosphoglycolate phosphatase